MDDELKSQLRKECIKNLQLVATSQSCTSELLKNIISEIDINFYRNLHTTYDYKEIVESTLINPNCSIKLLEDYVDIYPFFVIDSPKCPVYLYDRILNITDYQDHTIRDVARKKDCPDDAYEKMLSEVSYSYLGIINKDALFWISKSPNCSFELLISLYRRLSNMTKSPESFNYILGAIASNPNMTEEWLIKMAKSNIIEVREGVAINPSVTPEILEELSDDLSYHVNIAVASSSVCTPDILRKLSTYENTKVRARVAINKNTPEDVLYELSKDSNPNVRTNVVRNINCPIDIYRELINDNSDLVTSAIASKNNCPLSILKRLMYSDSEVTRRSVALNKNLTPDLIDILTNDTEFVKAGLAMNPNCQSKQLIKICKNNNIRVINNSLRNRNCPKELVDNLLSIDDTKIKESILLSPRCPIDTLTDYYNYFITKANFIEHYDSDISIEDLKKLSDDKDVQIRKLILEHPNCPIDIIIKYTNDIDEKLREEADKLLKKKNSYFKFKSIAGDNKPNKNIPPVREINDVEKPNEKDNIDLLKEIKQEEENKEEEIKKLILEHLERTRELTYKLETLDAEEKLKFRQLLRVRIPDNELLVKVGEHFEIRREYLPYLELIDFSFISSDNLKVSHIDWSKTNMSIDPQKVFIKDLSYCKVSDENLTFKDLSDCVLIGADLSEDKNSYGYENAIIDDETKLPKNRKIIFEK